MPETWCWVEARILSDDPVLRMTQERVARVWQPHEFLQGDNAGLQFKPAALGRSTQRAFQARPLPQPAAAAEAVQDESFLAHELVDAGLQSPPEEAMPTEPEVPVALVSEQMLEEARRQAYEQGLADGRREAAVQQHSEQRASEARVCERLDALRAAVESLREAPERIHEPLKRLALHLAEQLVLGELSQSPQVVERLVARCVEEIGAGRAAAARIELHPDDVRLLQPWLARHHEDGEGADAASAWQLQPNDSLLPGSVRLSVDDAVVTDLIEHRLDVLARQLGLDATRVRQQSALQPERLAARRAEVDAVLDAQPRMSPAARGTRFAPLVDAEAKPVEPGKSPEDAP